MKWAAWPDPFPPKWAAFIQFLYKSVYAGVQIFYPEQSRKGAGHNHKRWPAEENRFVSMAPAYPFTLDVDPAAPQSRLTVFFRIIMVIPHAIIVALLGVVATLITLAAWFIILFTGSYPAGMSSFVVSVFHWSARMNGYMYLLTGAYPPFSMGPDTSYPVRFAGEAQAEGRNRMTVFFRVFMIIPHYIVLYFLQIAAQVVLLIAWFAALFTGSVPAGMHNFVAGFLRWQTRYYAYAALLTDEYPPFSLN